mgnify:CR=1 FL=1
MFFEIALDPNVIAPRTTVISLHRTSWSIPLYADSDHLALVLLRTEVIVKM